MPRFEITQVNKPASIVPLGYQSQLPDTGGGAIANALMNAGNRLLPIAEKMLVEDMNRSISILGVRALKDLNNLEKGLKGDPDFTTHVEQYGMGVEALRKEYQGSVNTAVWKRFQPKFQEMSAKTGFQIDANILLRRVDRSRAELDVGLVELTRQYGIAENDADRTNITNMARTLIEGRVQGNIISQVEATNLSQKFTSDIIETQVRQDVFTNPTAAEAALLQGKYKGLTPEKRVVWLERATAKIEADLAKSARLADREERLAAKVLTQRQNATAKDGYQLLATNELTMDWINQNEDLLPKSDFKALLKSLTDDATVTDNVDVVADLYTRLATEDVGADAIAAYQQGSIRRETMGAILGRVDAILGGTGPKAPYRRGMQHIKTSLGVSEFQNIPGQRRRLADAVMDFDAWIERNGDANDQQILETARRLVREYSIADWNRLTISLPFPAYFVGTRVAPDIPKTKAALVQQYMTKHSGNRDALVADADYQRGVRIIRQWEDAVKLRDNGSGAKQQ